MYQSYSLSRYLDGDTDTHGTTFTVADDDPINCAHMLAAGFNTISRNMMSDFVLAVVDTKAGTVQYDGKHEQIKRPDPWTYEQTFKFEPSEGDADTILTLFGNGETAAFMASGKMNVEPSGPYEPTSRYEHIARSVLEDAYTEVGIIRGILEDAGVETIPPSSGVRELQHMLLRSAEQISELAQKRANDNEAARAELIKYVKATYVELFDLNCPSGSEDRFKGVLDVLAKFLVITGDADADEGHAVARRMCGIDDE